MKKPSVVRICSFSSSWPLVSTQLSVSSAWRLAHSPEAERRPEQGAEDEQYREPRFDRLRMPAFFEPHG